MRLPVRDNGRQGADFVGGVAEALTASTFRSDVRPGQCDHLGPYGDRSPLKRRHVRIGSNAAGLCTLCIKGDAGLEKPRSRHRANCRSVVNLFLIFIFR